MRIGYAGVSMVQKRAGEMRVVAAVRGGRRCGCCAKQMWPHSETDGRESGLLDGAANLYIAHGPIAL